MRAGSLIGMNDKSTSPQTATQWSEPMPDNPAPKAPPARKRKFLVIADGSEESSKALHFASLRAAHTEGAVTLLAVIGPADFQHWLGVEDIMRAEHAMVRDATSATAIAAVQASYSTKASAIIGLTTTGRTAHIASKYRAQCPFIAVTRFAPAARQMQLFRGWTWF